MYYIFGAMQRKANQKKKIYCHKNAFSRRHICFSLSTFCFISQRQLTRLIWKFDDTCHEWQVGECANGILIQHQTLFTYIKSYQRHVCMFEIVVVWPRLLLLLLNSLVTIAHMICEDRLVKYHDQQTTKSLFN